jgi:hypothetical protein
VDGPGSKAHEAFIYNSALGRLDVYTFDLWNMHQCQCPQPQEDMGICLFGFYRWSINAFTYLRNVTQRYKARVPKFDEPTVGAVAGCTFAAAPRSLWWCCIVHVACCVLGVMVWCSAYGRCALVLLTDP